MRLRLIPAVLVPVLTAVGCYTIRETPFPTVCIPAESAAATNVSVSVQGFSTTLTDYVVADGYQTVFHDGGPCGWGSGISTAHATTVIPQREPSDQFRERAKNRMERFGFNVISQVPDFVVEARFDGPFTTTGDTAASTAWFLCSLLTCAHGAQTWHARLKVYDNRTGRRILTREYVQKYEVTGFSPIPLLGISAYDRTNANYMQCWCLGALTDRMTADAAECVMSGK